MQTDVAVRDSSGEPVVTVEVKARRGKDAAWAAQLRRNLLVHGLAPRSRYFLLVTPDQTYLWRDDAPRSLGASRAPDIVVETRNLLGAQLDDLATGLRSLGGAALEHLVASWLAALIRASSVEDLPAASRSFAINSGLFEAVRGADVRFSVA